MVHLNDGEVPIIFWFVCILFFFFLEGWGGVYNFAEFVFFRKKNTVNSYSVCLFLPEKVPPPPVRGDSSLMFNKKACEAERFSSLGQLNKCR